MRILGNVLWHFPFFGFVQAFIAYFLGFILTLTIVLAPIGLGLMEFGKFLLLPFGKAMISKKKITTKQNKIWLAYSKVIMVIYVLVIGIWLFFIGVLQIAFLFITIIGIPVSLVIAKSLGTYLNPVNKICVHYAVADELEKREAQKQIDTIIEK